MLAVQAWIASAFYLFILGTSNPFLRVAMPPPEGQDLNPVLQDIGLAVHPPMLYLGYVGFSISFSFAVAALIEGRIDAAWARWVRPWTLVAWMFLTLGIAMGSYWAYYELGWGGWWFWDPVENASLMPWIAGTALLHSAVVMEKRSALKIWTLLLAILTFSLSLLGTFLVRSGVLTSVHSFATDPLRGVFILAILVVFIGGSLALYAWRAPALKQGGLFAPVSREGALVLNNLFLTTACATVFVGTLYPLALEALTGDKISVGAPFFNLTFGPLFVMLLLVVPFGPLLAWKRGDVLGAMQRLMAAGIAALLGIAVAFAWTFGGPALAPFGVGLACFVIVGAFTDLAERSGLPRVGVSVAARRLAGLPRSALGTALAHAGLGVTLLGIVSETTWSSEQIVALRAGERVAIAGYELKLEGFTDRQGPNYREQVARFSCAAAATRSASLRPRGAAFGAADLDHRGRADDARREPALRLARRQRAGRGDCGAHLSQAAGAADLARRDHHGMRRLAVAVRPAPAGRRAAPRQRRRRWRNARRPRNDRARCLRSLPSRCMLMAPRSRRAARRDHERSGEGGARARAVARIALHGVPEPVDRRFRRAAGARSAFAGARAHRRRRQRRAGDRFPRRALRAIRAAEAAAWRRRRCCCGCCRRWFCWRVPRLLLIHARRRRRAAASAPLTPQEQEKLAQPALEAIVRRRA